jgi:hypothetical protein
MAMEKGYLRFWQGANLHLVGVLFDIWSDYQWGRSRKNANSSCLWRIMPYYRMAPQAAVAILCRNNSVNYAILCRNKSIESARAGLKPGSAPPSRKLAGYRLVLRGRPPRRIMGRQNNATASATRTQGQCQILSVRCSRQC